MTHPPHLSVLILIDDKNIRQMFEVSLKDLALNVTSAENVSDAKSLLRSEGFDVLLMDFKLDGATEIDLLKYSRTLEHSPVFIALTAFASFENAINVIREGAFDYLPKPFSTAQLTHLLDKVRTVVELKGENERLKKGLVRPSFFSGMISPAMIHLQEFVDKVAPTDVSIFLVGENGTGKSELARIIQARSSRAMQPFVIVNCAALTGSLLESELFGHVKGAFTGAIQDRVGKLEVANHGTVLIEEICDLSVAAQAHLLKFVQYRTIERMGSYKPIPLDIRVIATTNRNLEEAVKIGNFREDLYFCLNTFEYTLTPLRFRQEDLPVLIQRFLLESSALSQAREVKKVPAPVMKLLLDYSWPGNIRELRNTIERMTALSTDREIILEDLPDALRKGSTLTVPKPPIHVPFIPGDLKTLKELERMHIEKVLSITQNQKEAADILGITTVTLWRKRKYYRMPL